MRLPLLHASTQPPPDGGARPSVGSPHRRPRGALFVFTSKETQSPTRGETADPLRAPVANASEPPAGTAHLPLRGNAHKITTAHAHAREAGLPPVPRAPRQWESRHAGARSTQQWSRSQRGREPSEACVPSALNGQPPTARTPRGSFGPQVGRANGLDSRHVPETTCGAVH